MPNNVNDSNVINLRTQTTFKADFSRANVTKDVVRAQMKQVQLDRAQVLRSVRALINSGSAYPYSRVNQWLISKRQAWLLRGGLTPELATQIMSKFQDKATDQQTATLQQVFEATQFDDWARNALEAGAICAGIVGGIGGAIGLAAGIGAAAGSAFPVVGTLIGAAVGFCIGVVLSIIPLEKWKVMDNFHSLTEKMSPVERYMLWGTCKRVQTNARRMEKRNPEELPAWWLKTGDFYTIFGGLDSVSVFMYEDLARQDCFLVSELPPPAPSTLDVTKWDQVALYGAACMASHGTEQEKMRDSLFYKQVVGDGKGSQVLKPYLELVADMPIVEFRAKVIAAGLRDFNDVPINEDTLNALAKREQTLAQK